jgi:outer membrane protein OmpA-like peptidoglycan-associated protein
MSLVKSFCCGLVLICITQMMVHAQGDHFPRNRTWLSPSLKNVNPGLAINTRYEETKPMLSADGRKLYFARKYSPLNVGGASDPQDIYVSQTTDGIHWSPARNAGNRINTPLADNLCGVIDDANFIFFVPTSRNHGRFCIRSQNNLPGDACVGPEIENESLFLEASFTYDRQVVLFTAKTKRNVNYRKDVDERDIYCSMRTIHGWTQPVNLGIVNTADDEFSPFLAADGRTLYFASNGRGGLGNADVFVARRIGNGWDHWTRPENLGTEINSPQFDGYFTLPASSNIAYMVSNSGSMGKSDIIAVYLPARFQPSPMVRQNFIAVDAQNGKAVHASIVITDRTGKISSQGTTDRQTGALTLFLPDDNTFNASAMGERYLPLEVRLSNSSRPHHLMLQPIPGRYHTWEDVMFEKSSARILTPSFATLDSVARALTLFPDTEIELRGHTDDVGTFDALQNLSVRRVNAVRLYLIGKGIEDRRISGKGYAGVRPIVKNIDEKSRQKNRRVEILIR